MLGGVWSPQLQVVLLNTRSVTLQAATCDYSFGVSGEQKIFLGHETKDSNLRQAPVRAGCLAMLVR